MRHEIVRLDVGFLDMLHYYLPLVLICILHELSDIRFGNKITITNFAQSITYCFLFYAIPITLLWLTYQLTPLSIGLMSRDFFPAFWWGLFCGFGLRVILDVIPDYIRDCWDAAYCTCGIKKTKKVEIECEIITDGLPLGFSLKTACFRSVLIQTLIGPAMEEFLYRGLIYVILKTFLPYPVAAIIVSLMFAAGHLRKRSLLSLPYFFFCSLVYTLLYEYSGSLAACFSAHAIFNLYGLFFSLTNKFLRKNNKNVPFITYTHVPKLIHGFMAR